MATYSRTTQIKLRIILQITFHPCLSPKIEVNSVFERDSVHKVVNYNSGVSGVVYVMILVFCLFFFFCYNTPYRWKLY